MEKLLIVEDDLALSAGLCFELETDNYITVAAYSCAKARQLLDHNEFDLVVLDINLPDGNGYELCRYIKETKPQIPVIFLTANDLEEDVLAGFELGAEDYVTKPFHTGILRKRIQVVLRRGGQREAANHSDCYEHGNLFLDFRNLNAVCGDKKIIITPNEYKILRLLIENAGNIVTRQLLLEKLWDCDENYIDDHTLTVNMNRLRHKIEDEENSFIKTIRGMGYIWTGGRL